MALDEVDLRKRSGDLPLGDKVVDLEHAWLA